MGGGPSRIPETQRRCRPENPTVNPEQQTAGVRNLFDLVADEYDNVGVRFFAPIAEGLVEAVGAGPGDRCLDVGCGTGASSVALASAIAPDGSLVAMDLSPAMVGRARAALDGRLSDVDVRSGDATDPGLPVGSFDIVIASLVVFFLPEPAAAVANWIAFESFEQWVRFSRSVGQRAAWEQMTDEQREQTLARARRIYDGAADANGRLPSFQQVRYTVGSAP